MKKLNFKYFALLLVLLIMACESPTVGYNTYSWGNISDFKYSLGSESSIETALAFNEAWNEREFDAMKELSGDSIKFFGGNGIERDFDWITEASSRGDSIRSANNASLETELKHIYSLVLNPDSGHEIVKTHFIYTYTDSLENINRWRQFETFIVKDGVVRRWSGSGQDIPEEDEEESAEETE